MGTFQVMRRDEVEFALQHPEVFSSAMEAVDLGQTVPLIPLQVDPPEHVKYRKLLDPIFAPKQMNAIEPDIARMVNELIDPFVDAARASSPPIWPSRCPPPSSSASSVCPCPTSTCSSG